MTNGTPDLASAAGLARFFHDTYERLAPDFGYETREASRTDWENVPEPNRLLMIAVAGEVLAALAQGEGSTAPGFACDECGADVLEQCLCPPFDVAADLPADTPEPPPSTQRRVDVSDDDPSELRGVRLMREGIEANEANASAGNPPVEPTPLDELLARHEAFMRAGTATGLEIDLASALRRKGEQVDEWKMIASRYERERQGLERELAEARSTPHGEVLSMGTITNTGSEDRAFVPRLTIRPDDHPSPSIKDARVLVVRAPADQGETDGE